MGSDINRRDLIKRAAAVGLVAAPTATFLTSCATSGGGEAKDKKQKGQTSARNPMGVKEGAPLEAFIFKGGFGDQYVKDAEAQYKKTFGSSVKHTGTQALGPKLQPRFAGGTPPDVMDNSGADNLDTASLAAQKKLVDLTPLLDAPAIDDPSKKVRDTLIAGTVEQGRYGGSEVYALNYAFTVFGTWYSQKLMADRGWEYPETFDDMIKLSAKIKKAGIAPFTYPGKFPYYVHFDLFAQIAKVGGSEAIIAIDNLEDGAWKTDAVRQVVEYYEEMAAKGYFLAGSAGMTHIQSQTAWTKGKAVFIPNGSWVENEAKPTMPKDFKLGVGPILGGGSGDRLPSGALRASAGEPFIVAADGKNPEGGMELLRIMLSRKQAQSFTKSLSALTCVKGAEEGLSLTPGLASASAALKKAAADVVNPRLQDWYPKLANESIGGGTGQLLTGKIKAAAWMERAQKAADATRKDSAIKKFKHS